MTKKLLPGQPAGGSTVENHSSRGGRPKTPLDVRALVLRMANDNGWGLGRIVGELNKLGIAIGKTTVKEILRASGFDLGPKRGQGTWTEFVERHATTLWACDFFQTKIWTMHGLVDYFALFFIQVGTRRVVMAGITPNPTAAWVIQQARNVVMTLPEQAAKPTHLIRDNDSKFTARFDAVFQAEEVEVVRTCVQAPNMNAYIERWIQALQVECLDHFVVFGEDHFRYLISEYQTHYNTVRPHQGLGNRPLDGHSLEPPTAWTPDQVHCIKSLGGVLKCYRWKVAA
jgi:putative transposase